MTWIFIYVAIVFLVFFIFIYDDIRGGGFEAVDLFVDGVLAVAFPFIMGIVLVINLISAIRQEKEKEKY